MRRDALMEDVARKILSLLLKESYSRQELIYISNELEGGFGNRLSNTLKSMLHSLSAPAAHSLSQQAINNKASESIDNLVAKAVQTVKKRNLRKDDVLQVIEELFPSVDVKIGSKKDSIQNELANLVFRLSHDEYQKLIKKLQSHQLGNKDAYLQGIMDKE